MEQHPEATTPRCRVAPSAACVSLIRRRWRNPWF